MLIKSGLRWDTVRVDKSTPAADSDVIARQEAAFAKIAEPLLEKNAGWFTAANWTIAAGKEEVAHRRKESERSAGMA
jgi:hypothetical protein